MSLKNYISYSNVLYFSYFIRFLSTFHTHTHTKITFNLLPLFIYITFFILHFFICVKKLIVEYISKIVIVTPFHSTFTRRIEFKACQ